MDTNKNKKKKDKKNQKGQPSPVQQPTPPGTPNPDGHVNTSPKGVGAQNVTEETPLARKEEKKEEKKSTKKQPKGSKQNSKKKSKKSSFLWKLITFRKLLIFYVLCVFFVCHGKTREQCEQWPLEGFCYNGISQYILTHDWFHKYIEPGVLQVKHYGGQGYDVTTSTYGTYAEPHVNPLMKFLQPYLQTVKDASISYIHTAQGLYDRHAKEHVDKYYGQTKKLVTPIYLKSQEYAIEAYTVVLKFNENKVRPFYRKQVVPLVGQAKNYYHKKIVPSTQNAVKFTTEKYNEHIVPTYRTHVKPHVLWLWDLIRGIVDPEGKRKADEEKKKKEAERSEKAKAELKARLEAENAAKEKVARKAKEEEDRKAKKEAEIRKAKEEEAARKAKEEADRKAKKEAEIRKAKEKEEAARAERKAKEEASVIKAVNDAAAAELPRYQRNILSATEELIQSAAQDTLNNIETELNIVKKSGVEHASKIENLVKVVSVDAEKNINQKILTIKDYVRQRLDDVKETTRKSTKRAEDSLIKLNETFENGYKDITDKRSFETRIAILSKADNQKIEKKIVEDIDNKILGITKDIKKEFSVKINIEISKIRTKIESIKKVARDAGQDIVNIQRSAMKSLKQQKDIPESASEKSSDQEQVGKVGSSKDDSTVNVKILSSDPVLEQLKITYRLRQDPVLQRLKDSYNEKRKPVSVTEDEFEEEEDIEEEDV